MIDITNKIKTFRTAIAMAVVKVSQQATIDAIVNKEKGLDEIDRKEKERKKSEFFQNKKYLEYVMNQKKEAELWMDQIVANEADKKWKKETI